MVVVNNVSKSFGQRKVVDNVSITIPEGKVTSLIGPNGAGKSTLLGMMSRLFKPDQGEIYIDGREIHTWQPDQLAQTICHSQHSQFSGTLWLNRQFFFAPIPKKYQYHDLHELHNLRASVKPRNP